MWTVAAPSRIRRAAAVGSRPTVVTRSCWRGWCGWASWSRLGCRRGMKRRRVIWFGLGRNARGDLMRARRRLSRLLLRHGLVYDGSAWTLAHDVWRRRQRFESRPLALAFEECYAAVLQTRTRRDALDQAIEELAGTPPFIETVGRLVCLRGVSTLTALALTVEIGDWARFRPQSLGPLPGPDRERALERREAPARGDHEDREHPRHAGFSSRPPGTNGAHSGQAPRSRQEKDRRETAALQHQHGARYRRSARFRRTSRPPHSPRRRSVEPPRPA